MLINIKLANNEVITRKVKHVSFGNFIMNIVRINNQEYLLGEGDEYLRGYNTVYNINDLRKLNKD